MCGSGQGVWQWARCVAVGCLGASDQSIRPVGPTLHTFFSSTFLHSPSSNNLSFTPHSILTVALVIMSAQLALKHIYLPVLAAAVVANLSRGKCFHESQYRHD